MLKGCLEEKSLHLNCDDSPTYCNDNVIIIHSLTEKKQEDDDDAEWLI